MQIFEVTEAQTISYESINFYKKKNIKKVLRWLLFTYFQYK